jgi:ABC-type transport system substrate-binding protein
VGGGNGCSDAPAVCYNQRHLIVPPDGLLSGTDLMATPSPSRRPFSGRLLGGLLALTLVVGVGGWLSAELAAQKPNDEVEDEKPGKTTKNVPKVDDDDPAPAKPRKRLQAPPEPEVQTSLTEAFKSAKNPELRAFFRDLQYPHDRITYRTVNDEVRTDSVEPLTQYYAGEQPSFKRGGLQVSTFDAEWRRSSTRRTYHSAIRVLPYEDAALEDVDQFLKKDAAHLRLTRAEMLAAAETALAAADRFHASARASGGRVGDAWDDVGRRLHERLLEVQREGLSERLKAITPDGTDKGWDEARAYAGNLAKTYKDPEQRGKIIDLLAKVIDNDVPARATDKDLETARDRFLQLEKIFGREAVADRAKDFARRLLKEADDKSRSPDDARTRMRIAAAVSPDLDNLDDRIARLYVGNPVLTVGVPRLPAHMVPGWAASDADRWAVELMYEGLVKLRVQPGVGERYEPALAGGAPRLVPLGREFRLARGAAWSNGEPVKIDDVKETLAAMRKESWLGYSPLWDRMIDEPEAGGDSSVLRLRLRQGYLDPLSLMTFKVMHRDFVKQANLANAEPMGSGPFRLKPAGKAGRVEFVANPRYGTREGKFGLPRVREIHFVRLGEDPVATLREGAVDVVLGLPAQKAKEAKAVAGVTVVGPLANRRVYFLALNHRDPRISGNVALRRALALAIDRQDLLDTYFREAKGAKQHHALNGPFPAGSWPCEPKKVPADLYNAEEAKAQAAKAVAEKGGEAIKLKVKYPAGDPATRAALGALCTKVNEVLSRGESPSVTLELQEPGIDPFQLREDVERKHDYEVAYYHYDHPSEAYWIAPLFDLGAKDINGSNYLGYIEDGALQAQFEEAKNQRDFEKVQAAMRLAHRMFDQKMPFVPLWQLDTFLAHRRGVDLKDATVDPLLIFNEVEKWKLGEKGN